MASFISALSLFVLVLATGCLALPISEEPLSSFGIDLTTSKINEIEPDSFNLRLVPDDETTELPKIPSERSFNEELNIETSTNILNHETSDNLAQVSRRFDELSQLDSFGFTTEKSFSDVEHQTRAQDDLSFVTVESITEANQHEPRSVTLENETEDDLSKREFNLELTTIDMPLFTSTSSDVSPQLYSTQSLDITSTEKYTGLLKDETDEEQPKKGKGKQKLLLKPKPTTTTTTKKTSLSSEDKLEEESNAPIAQLDQQALDQISNIPNDVMQLEESNDVVTISSEKLTLTTMENTKEQDKYENKNAVKDEHERKNKDEDEDKHKQEHDDEEEHEDKHKQQHDDEHESESEDKHEKSKPLNQGKDSSISEEKESDH